MKFYRRKRFIYTSQFAYDPPIGSRRWRELFSIASVNELMTYSFRLGTLNGGGTSNFRSRSILKLSRKRRSRIGDPKLFGLNL